MSALAQSTILPHGAAPAPCADPVGPGLRGLVGNTPLLAIRLEFRGEAATIYAKAEFRNLTGSIKDRMALGVLSAAYKRGELVPGQRIVEATSGNAGIALAAIGRAMGHPVTIFMPDWMSQERRALLSAHGAELKLVSAAEGGFLGSMERARTFAAATGGFLSRQFDNDDNWRAHDQGTGRELLTQMALAGARPDAFVAGVGTGGTVMGVARRFARAGLTAAVHPVEPAESPTLSTGYKVGRHRIQGVSDEFIPDIVKLDELAPVIAVNDGDAILMAQAMARDLGLGVGISSGGNIVAALKLLAERGPRTTVATVLCDNSARYLSTDLSRQEPVRPGYLTPDARLLGFAVVGG
ncbi:MAG: pyridoxal-phosphate dependent enzyme [Caulobacter sp.]|nr:pyridoxal-phosphate dependent enzyme [Caulobacter sp.]